MTTYPTIQAVTPQPNAQLVVTFSNQMTKVYDCRPLLQVAGFERLTDPALFRTVRRDPGGYGIVWDDELDLSESELWLNGQAICDNADDTLNIENRRRLSAANNRREINPQAQRRDPVALIREDRDR